MAIERGGLLIPDRAAAGLWGKRVCLYGRSEFVGDCFTGPVSPRRAGSGHGKGFGHGSDQIHPAGPLLLLLPDLFSIQTTGVVYQRLPWFVLKLPRGGPGAPANPGPGCPRTGKLQLQKLPGRRSGAGIGGASRMGMDFVAGLEG